MKKNDTLEENKLFTIRSIISGDMVWILTPNQSDMMDFVGSKPFLTLVKNLANDK